MKDKREKATIKAVFIGEVFEINGYVVPDNKRYQLPEKRTAEIDSDSSESSQVMMKTMKMKMVKFGRKRNEVK